MGTGNQTIGYRYYMSILSGICRGPVDEFVGWEAADKTVFDGSITENSFSYADKPNLFGGDKREGGVQGPFAVWMGADDQVLPGEQNWSGGSPELNALLGGRQEFRLPDVKQSVGPSLASNFRGVVTLWFNGLVSSLNPYIKEWSFRVRRSQKGWWNNACWYPEKATISLADGQVKAMNGAHIVYEACTNPQWGRGLPASKIDETSFTTGADTLFDEGFGLCLAWYRKEDIDVFIQKVVDLVGATVYTDRETGLLSFRLIRNDYNPEEIPLFTPQTGLVAVMEDDSASADSTYNEIIGTGRSPIDNKEFQIRAQNLAAFQSQQSVSSLDQDYRGIPTKELLSRIVLRDLRANASGLKRYNVVLDRRGWRVAPGSVFRVSDPSKGIENVILRAGEIDDGGLLDGRINIKTIQDVFGLPDTSYVTPVYSGWSPPPVNAEPTADQRLIEAGYRDLYRIVGAGDAQAAPQDAAYIGQLAAAPNTTSYQYDLATKAEGETSFVVRANGSFTGYAKLVSDITATQTSFLLTDPINLDFANIGDAVLIGEELMRIDAFDDDTFEATVTRGVCDTIPAVHTAGTRMWTYDDDMVSDGVAYTTGETVESKVLTRNATDVLPEDEASTNTIILGGRQGRPYPPADVRLNGASIYGEPPATSQPVISWANRNRITQADHLVGYFEESILPEVGQTVTIRVYDPVDDENPLRVESGIEGTSWTYTDAMQDEDSPPSTVRIEIESVRDGLASQETQSFDVALPSGWGYEWGRDWGG